MDRLLTGVVVFILARKISPVLTDFKAVTGEPMFFFYAPTGPVHMLIALAFFLLYGLRVYLKDRSDRKIISVFLLFIAVSSSVFAVIRYVLPVVTPGQEASEKVTAGPPVPGGPAPGFSASTLDGEDVRLSDYAGKPLVLNF